MGAMPFKHIATKDFSKNCVNNFFVERFLLNGVRSGSVKSSNLTLNLIGTGSYISGKILLTTRCIPLDISKLDEN